MKIEIISYVSVKSVAVVCEQAAEKLAYWLLKSGIDYHLLDTPLKEKTIKDMPEEYHKWLENHGFIKIVKEFQPCDVTFHIETEKELAQLWHRLNISTTNIKRVEELEYSQFGLNDSLGIIFFLKLDHIAKETGVIDKIIKKEG